MRKIDSNRLGKISVRRQVRQLENEKDKLREQKIKADQGLAAVRNALRQLRGR